MNWLITNAIGALLLPPLNLLLLLIFGMAMLGTRRRPGVAMLFFAIVPFRNRNSMGRCAGWKIAPTIARIRRK